MSGGGAAVGKDHCPGQPIRCQPPPQLAIDEVCDPPEKQSDRHAHHHTIGEAQQRNLIAYTEPYDRDDDAQSAAMETHAAFPDSEDHGRMREVQARLIEQHVAEASTEYNPE